MLPSDPASSSVKDTFNIKSEDLYNDANFKLFITSKYIPNNLENYIYNTTPIRQDRVKFQD